MILYHLSDTVQHFAFHAGIAPVIVDRAPIFPTRSGRCQDGVIQHHRSDGFPVADCIAIPGPDQFFRQGRTQQIEHARDGAAAATVHT